MRNKKAWIFWESRRKYWDYSVISLCVYGNPCSQGEGETVPPPLTPQNHGNFQLHLRKMRQSTPGPGRMDRENHLLPLLPFPGSYPASPAGRTGRWEKSKFPKAGGGGECGTTGGSAEPAKTGNSLATFLCEMVGLDSLYVAVASLFSCAGFATASSSVFWGRGYE